MVNRGMGGDGGAGFSTAASGYLRNLAIDFAPVADLDDEDDQPLVLDLGDDANVADPVLPKSSKRPVQRATEQSWVVELEQPVVEEAPDAIPVSRWKATKILLGPAIEFERPTRYFGRPSSSKYFARTSSHGMVFPSEVRSRSSARYISSRSSICSTIASRA
jgi:hypothetical protein